MSSSPTAPTSTTGSSTSSPSRADAGARGSRWSPAARSPSRRPRSSRAAAGRSTCTRCRRCCTTSPQLIAGEVRALAVELRPSYAAVVVGYADCGTYGALDEVCARARAARGCPGCTATTCTPARAGCERFFDEQPGTYVLTDFLVRSFARTVVHELGLDRWPELRDDYFGHYTRVVWLAQEPDDELRALAAAGGRAASGCR